MFYWFLYDANGNLASVSRNTPPTSDDVHDGYSMLGPYTDPLDSTTQDAFVNPSHYMVQNSVLTLRSNVDTLKLQSAQQAKISELKAGLNSTITGGFTSKTTGHTYKTDENGQSNMHGDLKRFDLDSTLASLMFYTMDAGWVSHAHNDLISAFLDGGKWKDAQYTQFNNLFAQVNSATDVTTVQNIVWTPATY